MIVGEKDVLRAYRVTGIRPCIGYWLHEVRPKGQRWYIEGCPLGAIVAERLGIGLSRKYDIVQRIAKELSINLDFVLGFTDGLKNLFRDDANTVYVEAWENGQGIRELFVREGWNTDDPGSHHAAEGLERVVGKRRRRKGKTDKHI